MVGFAEIALVVTLCIPGGANPGEGQQVAQVAQAGEDASGGCIDQVRVPRTWASANVLEASQDWGACKISELIEPLEPGEVPRCQYTAIAGVYP